MPQPADRAVLITGANAGIGKEVARQLALRPETAKVYLGCRDATKAESAKNDLETATGRQIFEIVPMEMTALASVRSAIAGLRRPIDALIMNAGGTGGDTPMTLTSDGTTYLFASNVLGHVVLLEGLIKEDKLTDVALLVGSEAARGVPKMRIARPSFVNPSPDEFATVIDGSLFGDRTPRVTDAY